MCVPLVTDSTIENGEMIVDTKGNGIKITVNDENGYPVSENVYGFKHSEGYDDNGDYTTTVEFVRIFNKGQIWDHSLKLTFQNDYSSMAGPTIVATGVSNLTKYEVGALVNAVSNGEYELTEAKLTKYGSVESFTFGDKPLVIEEDSVVPMDDVRFNKAKEMANQLISL